MVYATSDVMDQISWLVFLAMTTQEWDIYCAETCDLATGTPF
jgi:hypothetical protein